MEQQKTAQQQDELEEMQHGPVPVEQLQVYPVEIRVGFEQLRGLAIWVLVRSGYNVCLIQD